MGTFFSAPSAGNETVTIPQLQSEISSIKRYASDLETQNKDLQENMKMKDELIEKLRASVTTQQTQNPTVEVNSLKDDANDETTQEVNVTNSEVDETVAKVTNLKDGLINKANTYEFQGQVQKQEIEYNSGVRQQEIGHYSEETISELHRLNKCIDDRDEQIRDLKEHILLLEHQQFVQKQIKNAKKLRELEKLARKSVEIEDIIMKIKDETTIIAEDLKKRDVVERRQAVAVSSATDTAQSLTG